MENNKESFIKEINKYLITNLKNNLSFSGIDSISFNDEYIDDCFDFKFENKFYLVFFYKKGKSNQRIEVKDLQRKNDSLLLQYTIDDSNFITEGNNFTLRQNRGITIGKKKKGLELESKQLMYEYGFKNDIITNGNFLNPDFEKILSDIFYWMKIRIKAKLKLEERYTIIKNEVYNDDSEDQESKTEGGERVYISIRLERDLSLRRSAIKYHGTTCKVCSFNFKETYGEWAEEFIEVHHMKPLSEKLTKEVSTNPKTDLIVVCANCHSMIHKKRGITLTIEELRKKLVRTENKCF